MKIFSFCVILALCGVHAAGAAENISRQSGPFLTWGLLSAGSWEEGKSLVNRAEVRLRFPRPELQLRGLIVDKRPMDFSLSPPWGDVSQATTGFSGGLYHRPSGSRLLYGIVDEWGLSARIRGPWIRSAPFAENHQPLIADLRTTPSQSKKPEVYAYLSSPPLAVFPKTAMRAFISAQTLASEFSPDISGGIDTQIGASTRILLEAFYTGSTIPARKTSAWFADPPPLPEREFKLYAAGFLAASPFWLLSSDWAFSETFAVGRDMYGNLGIRITPPVSAFEKKPGAWSVSFAADGAGKNFTGRDGSSPGAGFRTAGKFELKGKRSSLFRLNTTLRSPGLGEKFTRSSSAAYYRFPAAVWKTSAGEKTFPLRINRVSLGANRDASNHEKIIDSIDGTLGLSLNLLPLGVKSPLGINFSYSVKGQCSANDTPAPYPLPQYPYTFNSAKTSGELLLPAGIFQFRTKWGFEAAAKKENRWDASFGAAIRHKSMRFSVKITSPDFPGEWNCSLSWHIEKK